MGSITRSHNAQAKRAAAAIAIAAFACEAYFFNAAGKSGAALIGGLAWALFCLSLFATIALRGKPGAARGVFFTTAALAFIPSFIAQLIEARGHMAVSGSEVAASQVPFCHIALSTSLLPAALLRTLDFPAQLSGTRAAFYPMLLYWLLSLVTVGRGWCGWVCFYGGIEDGVSSLAKKPRLDLSGRGPSLRRINYAMLAFVSLAALATVVPVYCDWLCPFKLVTEYSDPVDARSYLALIVFVGLFLGLVVVLPALSKRRTQCSTLCPFGAMQSLLDRLSPYAVKVDAAACVGCGACDRACPMLAIDSESRAAGGTRESCVKCGRCFEACRKGAIGYALRYNQAGLDLWKSLAGRAEQKAETGGILALLYRAAARAARVVRAALSPELVFPFVAMSFGMIISTGFSGQTMARLANLALTGSFSLGGLR